MLLMRSRRAASCLAAEAIAGGISWMVRRNQEDNSI